MFGKRKSHSEVGFVVNWKFHENDGWVSSFSPNFVNAFVEKFRPVIVTSQLDYWIHASQLKVIVSMEAGWAAPRIRFNKNKQHEVFMLVSDPHKKVDWLESYVDRNNIDVILSQYFNPFFYHFPDFKVERFRHFPWAVPDRYLNRKKELLITDDSVVAFGGSGGDAYDVRNWCKAQKGIISSENSGVENKVFSESGYFEWLSSLNAVVAAGSSNPIYDLVTPKYFEVCGAGALLIGQRCKDLGLLGFDDSNAVLFDKHDFNAHVSSYKKEPSAFLERRKKGRSLIAERHLISNRIKELEELFQQCGVSACP